MSKIKVVVSSSGRNIISGQGLAIAAGNYENATSTSDKAKYLYTAKSNGSVSAAEFAQLYLKEKGGEGSIARAEYELSEFAAQILDLVRETGGVTISLPFGTIETYCEGSTDSMYADPMPESCYLGLTISPDLAKEFAKIEATIPTGEQPCALKRARSCDKVEDANDASSDAGYINGTVPFYLFGRGMTYGRTGETIELWAADLSAKVSDVTVLENTCSSLLKCQLATAPAAGKYKLVMETFAGDAALTVPYTLMLELPVKAAEPGPTPVDPDFPHALSSGLNVLVEATAESLTYGMAALNLADGVHSFTVDWGDGTTPAVYEASQTNVTHTYAAPGLYQVVISDDMEGVTLSSLDGTGAFGTTYPAMVRKVAYKQGTGDPGDSLFEQFTCARNSTGLISVDLAEAKVREFSANVFAGCSALRTIVVPTWTRGIKVGAFTGCSALTSLTDLKGVSNIAGTASEQPFTDCTALTSVVFGAANREDIEESVCYTADHNLGLVNGTVTFA